jgi:hypothetical protein
MTSPPLFSLHGRLAVNHIASGSQPHPQQHVQAKTTADEDSTEVIHTVQAICGTEHQAIISRQQRGCQTLRGGAYAGNIAKALLVSFLNES